MKLYTTELGQRAFKERSPLFSARQRSTFILFDGRKTVGEVLQATAGMGMSQGDVDHMLAQGFLAELEAGAAPPPTAPMPLATAPAPLAPAPVPVAEPPVASAEPARDMRDEQQRYLEAKPLATQLTASLGLRGFMLNLSVEGASGYHDLLKLLPKIQDAVGSKACRKLERALLE